MSDPQHRPPSGGRGLMFFSAADARSLDEAGIMTPATISAEVLEGIDFAPFADGSRVKVLFDQPEMSLVYAWFGPGFRLPRHTHNADCLYYVLAGSAQMGSRAIDVGDGFFVRAGQPYAYSAGPNGVEVLEFRCTATFDMTVLDQTVEAWAPLAAAARANHGRWLEEARG